MMCMLIALHCIFSLCDTGLPFFPSSFFPLHSRHRPCVSLLLSPSCLRLPAWPCESSISLPPATLDKHGQSWSSELRGSKQRPRGTSWCTLPCFHSYHFESLFHLDVWIFRFDFLDCFAHVPVVIRGRALALFLFFTWRHRMSIDHQAISNHRPQSSLPFLLCVCCYYYLCGPSSPWGRALLLASSQILWQTCTALPRCPMRAGLPPFRKLKIQASPPCRGAHRAPVRRHRGGPYLMISQRVSLWRAGLSSPSPEPEVGAETSIRIHDFDQRIGRPMGTSILYSYTLALSVQHHSDSGKRNDATRCRTGEGVPHSAASPSTVSRLIAHSQSSSLPS